MDKLHSRFAKLLEDKSDEGFLEILYELSNGVRLDDTEYTLHNEESYWTIVEALKKTKKA